MRMRGWIMCQLMNRVIWLGKAEQTVEGTIDTISVDWKAPLPENSFVFPDCPFEIVVIEPCNEVEIPL